MNELPLDPVGLLADTAPAVLDPAALAGLAQLDPTGANRLVPRVLTTYLASLGRLGQQLQQGHAGHDVGAVRMAAHTLKSASASVGALSLAALCGATEQAVRDGQHDGLPRLLEQLLAEAQRVDAAVRRLLTD